MSEELGQEAAVGGGHADPPREAAYDVPGAAVPTTGHPGVDGVLDSLNGLDALAGPEQVAVYESAHEALRAALADAGNEH